MKNFLKKTVVRCSDYELYRIFLPWKCIFSSKKNFILRELEKMHPRFSGSCCYDTEYRVEKKNLLAEVVVMEKSSLAEYKNMGGRLYLENLKKRSVFSRGHRFFNVCTFLMIVAAGLLSFRIAKSLLNDEGIVSERIFSQTASSVSDQDCEQINERECLLDEKVSSAENRLFDEEELISSVFSSVSSHGGKISSFTFKKNDSIGGKTGGGVCTFAIYGCNCEDVANARYCVVSFKNNEPCFEMVLPFKGSERKELASEKTADDMSSLMAIRNQLRQLGALLESEQNGEDCVDFSFFASRENLYSCLKVSGIEAENARWEQKSLSISENAGQCKVKMSFRKNAGKTQGSLSPLFLAAQYAYLFGSEHKLAKKEQRLFTLPSSRQEESLLAKNKIGEIKKKDGSILICYRTSDGRMAFEKKEVKSAL